jgi:hypothetical protein
MQSIIATPVTIQCRSMISSVASGSSMITTPYRTNVKPVRTQSTAKPIFAPGRYSARLTSSTNRQPESHTTASVSTRIFSASFSALFSAAACRSSRTAACSGPGCPLGGEVEVPSIRACSGSVGSSSAGRVSLMAGVAPGKAAIAFGAAVLGGRGVRTAGRASLRAQDAAIPSNEHT